MFPLTPALSLKGEGVVGADIILWGSLTPRGEGENIKKGNFRCLFAFTYSFGPALTSAAPAGVSVYFSKFSINSFASDSAFSRHCSGDP